jgi:formylglycine-generating enzyme
MILSLMVAASSVMLPIAEGEYRPLYLSEDSPIIKVESFLLDETPVTNDAFHKFVQKNPRWHKQRVPSLFAEQNYLQHWDNGKAAIQPSSDQLESPVTLVSWFAASAYCQSLGKRLPTVAEWEYVAMASESQADGSLESGYHQNILEWYSRPNVKKHPSVGRNAANFWQVKDLHGLVWEWTEDFNSSLVNGESRNDSTLDSKLFCGAGAAGAADPSDYAAFMRFGFRSSLQAKFTLTNLGFRCAQSIGQP